MSDELEWVLKGEARGMTGVMVLRRFGADYEAAKEYSEKKSLARYWSKLWLDQVPIKGQLSSCIDSFGKYTPVPTNPPRPWSLETHVSGIMYITDADNRRILELRGTNGRRQAVADMILRWSEENPR